MQEGLEWSLYRFAIEAISVRLVKSRASPLALEKGERNLHKTAGKTKEKPFSDEMRFVGEINW